MKKPEETLLDNKEDVLIECDEHSNNNLKKQKKKSNIKRTVLVTLASCLTTLTVFGFASGAFITKNKSLPTEEDIYNNIMLLDPDTHYISINQNRLFSGYTRFIPTENEINYVVLDKNITKEQQKIIEDYIKDINYIFEYINPSYKFEVTTNYNLFTRLNANIIYVKNSNAVENNETIAAAHASHMVPAKDGYKTTFNTILLDKNADYSTKTSEGSKHTYHEFGHVWGFDDCYDTTPYYTSVMNTSNSAPDTYFSYNDLISLGCIYKKFYNLEDAKNFIIFACDYLNLDPEIYLPNDRSDNFLKDTLPSANGLPNLPNFAPNLLPSEQEK